MRSQVSKSFTLTETFKEKLLTWASQFYEVVWLDSNDYEQEHSNFKALLAVDALTSIQTSYHGAFNALEEYQETTKDWLFGYLTYDLKNDVEQLTSANEDYLGFPDISFFQPKKILVFDDNAVTFMYLNFVADEIDDDWEAISNQVVTASNPSEKDIKIRLRTSKDSYFEKVETMLSHIERGDIYEANFCQEFFSENTSINPITTFLQLNEISKPPFATFLKIDQRFLLSASPERYLKKEGSTVISQPIKGTAKRADNNEEDRAIIDKLLNDPKERSENIMITDLVRNDLSRFAKKGSVIVDELCKVYTFEQVHQLISTVRCEVDPTVSIVSLLRDTFPMGSMTGAPKVSAMKIIENLEDTKRGLYSGAVGYFTPDNNFDFNVIIRSILFNEANKYVSFSVGGAITNKSLPEAEYEECLLKAKAMRSVLE
ncbi:anthranilate synthase component I family protein [Patiriisocius hiemis]|uniref:Anthranilate synthase component I family protein n=1 Tax=Patiriisocius hiemis TaxID=3075604 RepID=A0ABU2YB62_9FLAO|nr:anthranilate synthase component I family protein [Constantimarinum sp. W242]MDT0555030.1 anthranilate synthase component I family protein [Constantimarinum sp. W242]